MKFIAVRSMFEVDDLQKAIDFYQNILGFELTATWKHEGHRVWANLGRDQVEVMLCVRNSHSTVSQPTFTGSVYFNVDDVDALWQKVKDKATVEYPVETFGYGMREFAIRDGDGYLLQFGQRMQND